MSRIILGDCLSVLPTFPVNAVDFVLTDPPYLCNYRDRSGRLIANDRTEEWLVPAFSEIHRVLKDQRLCVSFYGWHKVDTFFAAWRAAEFRVVGHLVFRKSYASKSRYVQYTHECATCWRRDVRAYLQSRRATSLIGRIPATSCTRRKSRSRYYSN